MESSRQNEARLKKATQHLLLVKSLVCAKQKRQFSPLASILVSVYYSYGYFDDTFAQRNDVIFENVS